MEQSNSVSKRKTGLIAVLVALLCVGGAIAYLTDSDVKTNKFDVVTSSDFDKEGWLQENKWDEATKDSDGTATDVTPGKVIVKDPTIYNLTSTKAWLFMEVSVPQVNGADAFLFDGKDLNNYTGTNGDFTMISKTGGNYVFAVSTAVDPNSTKGYQLFGNVNLKTTLTNDQLDVLDGDAANIVVTGHVVQYISDNEALKTAKAVWESTDVQNDIKTNAGA